MLFALWNSPSQLNPQPANDQTSKHFLFGMPANVLANGKCKYTANGVRFDKIMAQQSHHEGVLHRIQMNGCSLTDPPTASALRWVYFEH